MTRKQIRKAQSVFCVTAFQVVQEVSNYYKQLAAIEKLLPVVEDVAEESAEIDWIDQDFNQLFEGR